MYWRAGMIVAVILMLCASVQAETVPISANQVIWTGQEMGFVAPQRDTIPENVSLEIMLGYGEASNTIGGGLWLSKPGVYDLSDDPNMSCFLIHAMDTVNDSMSIYIKDIDGYQQLYCNVFSDSTVFKCNPQYQWPPMITGVQLTVLEISPPSPGNGNAGGISLRWDFLGIPEPSSILCIAACVAVVLVVRR